MYRINLIILGLLISLNAFNRDFNIESNTKQVKTVNGTFPVIDYGSGIPVILLHGFPDCKELWENQIPALADAGYRVIAPDLRGYGNAPSPLEKEQYSMPILMSDVIGILDKLGLESVHLIGHDFGASLSWQLAKYYEHRFKSLTVLSVGFPGNAAWLSVDQRQRSWYFYLFLQEGLAEKTFADYNWNFAKQMLHSHGNSMEVLQRLQKPNALTTALNWYRGNMQYLIAQPAMEYTPTNKIPALPQKKIEIPVQGIWSTLDIALLEPQMKRSVDYASNFSYAKIEGAGHWMMLDKPDELNSLILKFLNNQN